MAKAAIKTTKKKVATKLPARPASKQSVSPNGTPAKSKNGSAVAAPKLKKAPAAAEPGKAPSPKKVSSKGPSAIPRRILTALGLAQPVVGVFKHSNRPHYGVAYRDETGRRCSKAFSYRNKDEEVAAYSQAVKFRTKSLRGKPKVAKKPAR